MLWPKTTAIGYPRGPVYYRVQPFAAKGAARFTSRDMPALMPPASRNRKGVEDGSDG
jgi:hypothetical protein